MAGNLNEEMKMENIEIKEVTEEDILPSSSYTVEEIHVTNASLLQIQQILSGNILTIYTTE